MNRAVPPRDSRCAVDPERGKTPGSCSEERFPQPSPTNAGDGVKGVIADSGEQPVITEASPGDAPADAPVATTTDDTNALPFVAPCRRLGTWEPIGWLRLAWGDFKTAPRQSLTYGAVVVLLSWALAYIAIRFGGYFELLALVSGFILLAPLLAVGTYSISEQIERGRQPSLRRCLVVGRRAFGNLMVFALILMIVFLVWWRAASAVHIFFPVDMASPDWTDYLQFLGIGSAVGSIFAVIVFAAAAFSLPMLVDREADSVTAVVTSVNAVPVSYTHLTLPTSDLV